MYIIDKISINQDGVLVAEDLIDRLTADYKFDRVDGPLKVDGQNMFVNIYVYKDAKKNSYYYRSIQYQFPAISSKNLIDDSN